MRVINHILRHLPPGRRLIEPFVGGASVFLASDYEEYLLGDSNRHLIELYTAVANRFEEFTTLASSYFFDAFRSKERYIEVRNAFNHEREPLMRAAQFLYLNRFGFNGLCRYNRSGGFNVPYGKPSSVPPFPADRLRGFHNKASRASFVCGDFAGVMQQAEPGDVIYCDPPYLPRDGTELGFEGYTAAGFGLERQRELADLATTLSRRGIPVLISNHDCELAHQLYREANLVFFDARRSVSANSSRRGNVRELLAVFNG